LSRRSRRRTHEPTIPCVWQFCLAPRAPAQAAGAYEGRPASIDAAQVRAMKAQGLGASEIAKALKIGRASVYRVLEAG